MDQWEQAMKCVLESIALMATFLHSSSIFKEAAMKKRFHHLHQRPIHRSQPGMDKTKARKQHTALTGPQNLKNICSSRSWMSRSQAQLFQPSRVSESQLHCPLRCRSERGRAGIRKPHCSSHIVAPDALARLLQQGFCKSENCLLQMASVSRQSSCEWWE